MRYVIFDFETASRADLLKIGAWKYAADLTTFPLCLSIKVVTDGRPEKSRVITEKQLHALDVELLALASDPEVIFIAHNASFEAAMWHFHLVPMGYPPMPPEKMHDTMASAAMKALPLGLDAVVTALELPVKKDMDGHRHMLMMCKPDRDGGWSHHTPENLQKLYDYCAGDTDAQHGVYVSTMGLGPSERHTWILDQRVNQRGILIDTNFVDACIDVLDQVRIPMTERFRQLTGLKPTQREKVLNWVNDQGVPLGDMRKETLNAILDPDDEFGIEDFAEPLPYHVHEVLTLRRSLASSSVAKLERMLACAGSDGRVRYTTQYHGARTGRDAGRLIQIQNYPIGEIGDRQGLTAEALADAILTRELDHIREMWGPDIFTAVISSLRSCIIADEGKTLVVGDYATVEARNLLSMAGQHDRVEQMHSGQDMYSEVASMIFKRPINRKLPEHYVEGKIGKQTFLGCLAADTQVLTRNGWKAIVGVLDTDLLWDGENWVIHQGLAYKGSKETLILSGVRMTPDHPVFIGDRWSRADEVTFATHRQALAFAKVHGPCSVSPTQSAAHGPDPFVSVPAEKALYSSIVTTLYPAARPVAMLAQNESPPQRESAGGVMPIFARRTNTARGYSTEFHQSLNGAIIRNADRIKTMAGEAFVGISWIVARFLRTYLLSPDGITPHWKLIGRTTTGTMNPEISGSQPEAKTWETGGKYAISKPVSMKPWKKSPCSEPVYDLVNAGPLHRFTIWTCDGPLIVHNSGYGLGPVGHRARFNPRGTMELSKLCIDTYRNEVAPKVPAFWYGLYKASVDAVWCNSARTYEYAGVEFRKEGDFLTMRLPSGRKIYYHRPRKATSYAPNGNEYPAWTFMSYQGKKFRRHLAWHGMITADCIQGSARDLMVGAMKRAEAAGLFTVFKVHDELVFEEPNRPDLVTTVKQIMEDVEPWAIQHKFRVKAEVEAMQRYHK